MDFGEIDSQEAEGCLLAHTIKAPGLSFKKGRRLSAADIKALREAGIARITAARLSPDDLHEDEAAARIAAAICGEHLEASAAFTGRCNLVAKTRGLAVIERPRLDAFNLTDESITIATVPPFELVEPRQMVATVKVIPFAAPEKALEEALMEAGPGPLVRIAALRPRQVGLVQTDLPGTKASILDKTLEALNHRLAHLDCPPALERRAAHRQDAIAKALEELRRAGCELLLVSGASAIVDRRDVVPEGIAAAGGRIVHFGMPVDPGNLLLLADWKGTPVLGLPGCARSPKANGFDWVLQRLLCDIPVEPSDIMLMGAGGLLKEIAQRPLPRSAAVEGKERAAAPRAPRIAALVLAAGQSRRMGRVNKLLAEVAGKPLVRHSVETALASQAGDMVVVTGHEAQAVAKALDGLPVVIAQNPDYESGLASSLKRGLASLPGNPDGVLVMLGDMPRISPSVLDRLIAAFNPAEGRAICLPTWKGKRGNPVLIGRRFFAELQTLQGDVGARHLLSDYPEEIAEVAMEEPGVLQDIDTPEDLAALTRKS